MKRRPLFVIFGVCALLSASASAQPERLTAPAQDQGLPYTRSGRATGLAVLKPYVAALFATPTYGGRGKWMSAADKDFMRRFNAKATYGRRDNMQAAPLRVRDINHMTWHLTNFLAVSAIKLGRGPLGGVQRAHQQQRRAGARLAVVLHTQLVGTNDRKGNPTTFDRASITVRDTEARFRVLLLPLRAGEPRPVISNDVAAQSATVAWPDSETDRIQFVLKPGLPRTGFAVRRSGATLVMSP